MAFSVRDQCANVVGDRKGKGQCLISEVTGGVQSLWVLSWFLKSFPIRLLQGGVLLFV